MKLGHEKTTTKDNLKALGLFFFPNLIYGLEVISYILIYLHRLEKVDSIHHVPHTKQIQTQKDGTQDHISKKLLYLLNNFHYYIHQVALSR